VRRRALLCVLVLVAAGCGGGDDDDTRSSAAESTVIQSDDGRATLTLPDGVDGDGMSVEAADVDGVVAYELLPAGTTFDEPAVLTLTDVESPAVGAVPLVVLLSDDGTGDLVDGVTTTYDDEDVTVVVPIEHFSVIQVRFQTSVGPADLVAYAADFGSPREADVGVPFEVPVAIEQLQSRIEVDIPYDTSLVITLDRATARGAVTGTSTTPSSVRNLPRFGDIGASYRGSGTLECNRAGTARLEYRVDFRFYVNRGMSFSLSSTDHEVDATLTMARRVRCRAGLTSSTSSSSTTTTTIDDEALKPVVTEIKVELQRPVTTYTATAESPDGSIIEDYVWRMSGEDCGTPRTPWEQTGTSVTWSHADTPPDSCPHHTEDHAVTVSLTVTDEFGLSTVCTFGGSSTRTITDPTCT
jgi:hypothetical protein